MAGRPIDLGTVKRQLQDRLEELEDQIEPLQEEADEIRTMLYPPKPNSSPRSGSYGNVSDELKAAVMEAVRDNPDQGAAVYADMVGEERQTVSKALAALVESAQLVKEGERRGTRYKLA